MAEWTDDRLVMRAPDDFHLHLRQGAPLEYYTTLSKNAGFARAIVMPNTTPAINTPTTLKAYREEIERAGQSQPGMVSFTPLMTFKLMPGMTPAEVQDLHKAGAVMGKYYPAGATTNSSDGLSHWSQCEEAMGEMERLGMVFSIHGEDPLAPALEREQLFLDQFREMVNAFSDLKMVFEHISSAQGVEMVMSLPDRIGASVTAHHLLLTQEDLLGGGFNPHLFCRPLPKTARDRKAIQELVLSGAGKIFFGSDSAPHIRSMKECSSAAAGIFTAPVALPLIIDFFEKQGKEDLLEPFLSERGADFYGLPRNKGEVTFVREDWLVPGSYGDIVPMMAGEVLSWRLQ
jgi:dihydroorotase